MKKITMFLCLLCLATGCLGPNYLQQTIADYRAVSGTVNLGAAKGEVELILGSSQRLLTNTDLKHPDKFLKDGKVVEIIYYRTGFQNDGITTDDEFTPYVFEDGKLVAIGWATLGGAKTQGQSRDEIQIHNHYDRFPHYY